MSVTEDWGTLRVVIDGTDVTRFRGGLVMPTSWQYAEPFGCGPATIEVSNVVPQETIGGGPLSWLHAGAPVDIVRLHPDGTTRTVLWSGQVITTHPSISEDSWTWGIECSGAMWVADYQHHHPPTFRDPTDIGIVIARDMTAVISRRYGALAQVLTGIATNQRGSSDSSTLQWVQELLSTAVTDDGTNQWTVNRGSGDSRTPVIQLKDRTTVHWTARAGQPGVQPDLSRDVTQAPNAIYGRGISTGGYAWANWVYPNAHADDSLPYPFSSAGSVITVGTTDGGTTSGHGVSDWQRRVNELNITNDVSVDGVYNTSDAAACRVIQRHFGILEDGIVGPQTWSATFDVGANVGDLSTAFRLPLAWDTAVVPRLWHADGSDAGPNSHYNNEVIRVEADYDFGAGVSKDEGRRAARALLARDYPAGWAGTLNLTADPNEGSLFNIREGQNFKLQSWAGSDVLLHISGVQVDPVGLSASLTVDEKARDLLTLVQVIDRNRDNANNPARMPAGRNRRSRIDPDHIVEFDGESPGGRIPRMALFHGLWSVIRIPVSQSGQIAQVAMTTTSPAAPFAFALFGAPVTADFMVAKVGNPLASDTPWTTHADDLENAGWIEGWGSHLDAAGYYPGAQSQSNSLTGRFLDQGGLNYLSARPPWVWVAIYSSSDCFITGRLRPAPLDQ